MKWFLFFVAFFVLLAGCLEKPVISFPQGVKEIDSIWIDAGVSNKEITATKSLFFPAKQDAVFGNKLNRVESKLKAFEDSLSQYSESADLAALKHYTQLNLLLVSFLREMNAFKAMNPLQKIDSIKSILESSDVNAWQLRQELSSDGLVAEAKKALLSGMRLKQEVASFKAMHSFEIGSRFDVDEDELAKITAIAEQLEFLRNAAELQCQAIEWFSSFNSVLDGGVDCSELDKVSSLVSEAELISSRFSALARDYNNESLKGRVAELDSAFSDLKSMELQLERSCK